MSIASEAEVRRFKPLVVGSPRSGFTLLCSVVINFVPLAPGKLDLRQRLLNALVDGFGGHISNSIVHAFAEEGVTEDLVYNPSFRKLTGGPKWLSKRRDNEVCFRKYAGVRRKGDFTLITSHPREVLDYDEVVHSHSDPGLWLQHPDYTDCCKFASVRNPIGIINSSLFSINALASEYIQRFVPPEDDNDGLRRRLALYKFTNLDFFEGLVKFYANYFAEFMVARDSYIVMRWEDLITRPAATISLLAQAAGLPVSEDHAAQIWQTLDHVNLTGHHKHNYRRGKGKVGDWKNWMTNRHLAIIGDYGFEPYMEALGYGPIPDLDETSYTPFQKRVDEMLRRGEVFNDYPDRGLFEFAFNKSNLDSSKFPFRRYDWKEVTQVERSSFSDEGLLEKVWEAAEVATKRLNTVFRSLLDGRYGSEASSQISVGQVKAAAARFASLMPKAYEAIFPRMEGIVHEAFRNGAPPHGFDDGRPPKLIRSYRTHNMVAYQGWYYGVPQSAGVLDLAADPLDQVPGVIRERSFTATQTAIEVAESAPQAPEDGGPRHIRAVSAHNIVAVGGRYWGIPHALGPLDLTREDVASLPGVLSGCSPDDVEALLAQRASDTPSSR